MSDSPSPLDDIAPHVDEVIEVFQKSSNPMLTADAMISVAAGALVFIVGRREAARTLNEARKLVLDGYFDNKIRESK